MIKWREWWNLTPNAFQRKNHEYDERKVTMNLVTMFRTRSLMPDERQRRKGMFTQRCSIALQLLFTLCISCLVPFVCRADSRPNILFCISDDQSWLHTGAMGDPVVKTPAFDRIAREGILFTHAFCDAPSCGPSRSAILTGQHIWRLEEAGNIHSRLPDKFATLSVSLNRRVTWLAPTAKLGLPVSSSCHRVGSIVVGRK